MVTDFQPVMTRVWLPSGCVIINTDTGAKNAAVSLRPQVAGDKQAIELIEKTVIEQVEGTLVIRVPEPHAQSVTFGRNSVVVRGSGNVVVGSGRSMTIINGQVISGGGANIVGTGSVVLSLRLRAGSNLRLDGDNLDVESFGALGEVEVNASNGSARIVKAHSLDVESTNATVTAEEVARAEISTSNGSIKVGRVTERARLRTTNGSIKAVTETADFRARTTNGSVRVTARGVQIDKSAVSTTNGSRKISHV
jgi:hypothetical protein